MAEPMTVSMTIKVVDEASAEVRGVAAAYRELKQAGDDLGRGTTATGAAGLDEAKGAVAGVTAALKDEAAAVAGVTEKVGALRAATADAAAPIGDAIGRLRDEGRAVDDVTAKMRELAGTARTAVPSAGGAGGPGGGGRPPEEPPGAAAGPVDWGDRAGRNQDWGAYWAAKRQADTEGGAAKPRASDWVAQQQAVHAYGEEVGRASERVEELEAGMARLGMVGMAFGQVRQFGETLKRPVDAVDDAFTDFQAKTQDLATRSGDNGGQKAVGDHILKVARDANVPWQQVYEGEQALASLGGGDQLKAMQAYETRMNQLALAGHVETRDIYGAMMHYIKGGLSAAEAMDALEQQHVQGKRGSYELTNMARGMPRLMALGREFGMTPKQAAVDTSALLQILRDNTGSPEQADVLAQHVMTKLGDPRTMKRLQGDLGVDGFADREQAQREGVNPLFHLLNTIADKFAALSPEQKGKLVPDADGHGGDVQGGDPRIMGDLARDYYFRAALDAFIQHRADLPEYDVPLDEARRTTDEDYAAQNSTVKQSKQSAENRKAEAEVRTGETQAPVMKGVARVEGAAYDAGTGTVERFPTVTAIGTAITGFAGSALKLFGEIGEGAVGAFTAFRALQWIGTRYPAIGAVADTVGAVATAPVDAVKGFAGGVVDGARQARADAARGATPSAAEPAPATDALAKAATQASAAATDFAAASTSLGTLGMLAAWAARRDVGMGRAPTPESLARNPLGIRLPGDPEPPPAAPPPPVATRPGMRGMAPIPILPAPPAGQGAIAAAQAPLPPASPPKPTAAEAPQTITNNNQKTVNAPITVNAPVTINATMTNTTPAAVGAAVGGAIQGGVRAGAGALHDGTETK